MRLVICKERGRATFKREDLSQSVLKDVPRQTFQTILPVVQEKLKNVFGMELVELPARDKGTSKKAPAAPSKQFVLRSTLPPEKMSKLLDWKAELPKMSVLYVILALIMMSNNVLSEG